MASWLRRGSKTQSTLLPDLVYRSLGPRQIRLLRLEGSRKKNSIIECSLEHVSLDHPPQYIVLSYVWGTDLPSVPIHCDRSLTHVTKSLHEALSQLRNGLENGVSMLVWADQLCINQDAVDPGQVDEKNQQVAMMKEIYANGGLTLIWLGEHKDYSSLALAFLYDMAINLAPLTDAGSIERVLQRVPPASSKEWKGVASLLHRPWFSRLWVLQEVTVSSRCLLFVGSDRLRWEHFSEAISALENTQHFDAIKSWERSEPFSISYKTFQFCQKSYQARVSNQQPEGHAWDDLEALLQVARQQNLTNELDRIYAILGLCNNTLGIAPNYRLSAHELFKDVANRLSMKFQQPCPYCGHNCDVNDVSLLYQAERWEDRPGLPSWVPDWSPQKQISLWAFREEGNYNASHSARSQMVISPGNTNHVVVRGKIFDCVIKTGDPYPESNESIRLVLSPNWIGRHVLEKEMRIRQQYAFEISKMLLLWTWLSDADKNLIDECHAYGARILRGEALWRTLCGNMKKVQDGFVDRCTKIPFDNPDAARFHNEFVDWIEWCAKLFGLFTGGKEWDVISEYARYKQSEELGFWGKAWLAPFRYRKFFVTQGGYLGLGPVRMQKETDKVCVILGAPVPMIIRRQENGSFTLIGECYVHGIMEGEAMTMDEIHLENITLA